MNKYLLVTIISLFSYGSSLAVDPVYDIADFGAKGDGATVNTKAIQQAIDAAAAAGGGIVRFSAGKWLSGTIELKSHVTLRLEQGSTLLGSTNLDDYPEKTPATKSLVNLYCTRSLIYAEDLDDIAIEGDGTIDGNGSSFPVDKANRYLPRPFLLRVISCRDVRVERIFMTSSAMWTQHYLNCDRVRVNGIRVWGFANFNNDAMDIDGCRDVIISNCFFNSSDDGITLKSTSDHPMQGVIITNCVVRSRSSAIKLGTDSSWGFKDITISNCTVMKVSLEEPFIYGPERKIGYAGIVLMIVDGGEMERVAINNISIQGYLVPLCIRLGDRGKGYVPERTAEAEIPPKKSVGTVRDISIANIVATEGGRNVGILLLGHPGHPLENISLSNITIRNEGGGEAELAKREVPERAHDYPQAAHWGDLPGYGLYARHVKDLVLSNIRLETARPDKRHALVLDDVDGADLNAVTCLPGTGTTALMRLSQSRNVLIRSCNPQSDKGLFLKVEGENSSGIALIGNNFSRVTKVVEFAGDVPDGVVRQAGNLNPTTKQ